MLITEELLNSIDRGKYANMIGVTAAPIVPKGLLVVGERYCSQFELRSDPVAPTQVRRQHDQSLLVSKELTQLFLLWL
jgi:hypothetical protein